MVAHAVAWLTSSGAGVPREGGVAISIDPARANPSDIIFISLLLLLLKSFFLGLLSKSFAHASYHQSYHSSPRDKIVRIANLVGAIILLGLVVFMLVTSISAGHMPTPRALVLDGALLLFSAGRFIAFGMPGSPIIRPLRMVGLVLLVGYMLMKSI